MKKNTIVRHCFSRKYISLCIFLLLGIIGEKAFAYSVWETYANETEGIYFSLQESIKITGVVKDNKGEPIIGANIVELNKRVMVLLQILMVSSHYQFRKMQK